MRVESSDKDFSIAFPSNSLVNNRDGVCHLYYSSNGNNFSVSIQKNRQAKSEFQNVLPFIKDKTMYDFFKLGDFLGKQLKPSKETKDDYLSLDLASSKGKYVISVSTKNSSDYSYERVLYSIRLDGKALFIEKNPSATEEKTVLATSLETSPEVLNALKQEDSEQSNLLIANEKEKIERDETIYSRGLIVLAKPRPSYTDSTRQGGVQGTVRFKVTFLANGHIGNIFLVSSLDKRLDKQAFYVVKKVKFLPAEIAGKPVDITRTIEYSFAIY